MAIVGSIASLGMTKSCRPGNLNLCTQVWAMELDKASGPSRQLAETKNTKQTEASSLAEEDVVGGVTVKHERLPEEEVNLAASGKGNIETDDVWLRVTTEIKEEMEGATAPSSCAIEVPQHQIKMRDEAERDPEIALQSVQSASKRTEDSQDQKSKAVEGQLTELEPQVAERRRLTRKTMEIEAPNPVKKEVAVKVKKERQDANITRSERGNVEMHALWEQIKIAIKEETEQDAGPSSFAIDIPEDQINVKEEAEEDGQANRGSTRNSSKHSEDAIKQSGQDQSGKASNGRTADNMETHGPKRRRLTGKTMQAEAPSSVKKVAGDVQVKHERPPDQEANLESVEKNIEKDDLWLRVRQEIEKHGIAKSAASAGRPASGLPLDADDLEDAMKLEACQDPGADRRAPLESNAKVECKDPADAERSSLDAFAKQAATWAKQCLAFRSSQTWSPTRPCCPANFFLASLNGLPSPPAMDALPCILRLTGRGLRCLQQFRAKQSQLVTSEGDASLEAGEIQALPDDFGTQAGHSELKVQDYGIHGRDCMNMWPWMRDLPTRVWAGGGWAFDENGLRHLSSPSGSQAMQGVEVFESAGAAAEEVQGSDEHMEQLAVPTAAGEGAAPPPEGPKPSKFRRSNLAKQSGVPNVKWNKNCAWEVSFPKVDAKGNKVGSTNRKFVVKKFIGPGMDEAEADAAALQAAKNFRAELVKQGVLSEPKPRDPNFISEVPGVKWREKRQKWEVEIALKPHADGRQNKLRGGYFTDKAEAEAKALELRQQHGLERQVKTVSSLAELAVFEPKVPYPGVRWEQRSQQWRAQCQVAGRLRNFYVKPKDHSEEELERSFQVAVAWKKKQEKERETAVRVKAKPQKKLRK